MERDFTIEHTLIIQSIDEDNKITTQSITPSELPPEYLEDPAVASTLVDQTRPRTVAIIETEGKPLRVIPLDISTSFR